MALPKPAEGGGMASSLKGSGSAEKDCREPGPTNPDGSFEKKVLIPANNFEGDDASFIRVVLTPLSR